MKSLTINTKSEFTDIAELTELEFNNACSFEGELYLNGYQYDFNITVINKNNESKEFNISFQTEERSNGLESYSCYGVDTSAKFGNDFDQSNELELFLSDTDEENLNDEIIKKLSEEASIKSRDYYNDLIKDSEIKNKIIALGGKEWSKNDMERVYITNDILNTLQDEKHLGNSRFGERNNKIFLDVKTSAIMRSYKGKKPSIEIQL